MTDWSALFLSTVKQAERRRGRRRFRRPFPSPWPSSGCPATRWSPASAPTPTLDRRRRHHRRRPGAGDPRALAGAVAPPASRWSASAPPIVVPVVFSAASRVPGMPPNLGIAAVTTMGYAGFLSVPPILGFVGHTFGLSTTLALVALMGVAVAGARRGDHRGADRHARTTKQKGRPEGRPFACSASRSTPIRRRRRAPAPAPPPRWRQRPSAAARRGSARRDGPPPGGRGRWWRRCRPG